MSSLRIFRSRGECPSPSFNLRETETKEWLRGLDSVNSRHGEKSKCPIWCRLQQIHSRSFSTRTQSCTQIWATRTTERVKDSVGIVSDYRGLPPLPVSPGGRRKSKIALP